MLNVSTLLGVRAARSDALRYGEARLGERVPESAARRRPVVVWNVTRSCNLACLHCYSSARIRPAHDELETEEAEAFLRDLADYEVAAVLLSGGEPLSRVDLPHLVRTGTERGLRFTLSTNGTLIDADVARILGGVGLKYVGVSVDGDEAIHDRFRRQQGAYGRALEGLRHLRAAGVKRGVRFTVGPENRHTLTDVLKLVVDESVERFCLYHLVPAGRGQGLVDLTAEQRLEVLDEIFTFAATHPEVEVLTVDNPSDGPALCRWLQERDEEAADRCRRLLAWNRGARSGSGIGLACVDERGDVHPDQFSRHRVLGNIRERPFSELWEAPGDPYIEDLRSGERPLPQTCRACPYLDLCGGGLRVRAENMTGDPWGFDPSCTVRSAA